MNRRAFLVSSLAVAAASRSARAEGRSAVVVGAGAAGLSAAQELIGRGWSVTVLEAQGRVGGRLWTSRLWTDAPVDLGASWLHGVKGHPAAEIARAEGLRLIDTDYDSFQAFGPGGEDVTKAWERDADRLDDVMPDDDCEPGQSAADVLESAIKRGGVMRAVAAAEVENEFAADLGALSACAFEEGEELKGGDAVIAEGYDRIAAALARGLDIRLNTPVQSVAATAQGARVVTAGGALETDAVIVTAPLGALQAGMIALPDLPPAHQRALGALGMGLLNKYWMRFDKAFWPQDTLFYGYSGSARHAWPFFLNASVLGAPIMLGFTAGSIAREMEGLSDADTAAAMHEALRGMFGEAIPRPAALQPTRWSQEQWTRGAYSFLPVGAEAKMRRDLAEPFAEGRIVLAGEALDPGYAGSVRGAIESGRRASKRLA